MNVKASSECEMITLALLQATMSLVQLRCSKSGAKIVDELEKHVLASKLMDALGIVYPQYCVMSTFDDTFPQHLSILKAFYGVAKKLHLGNVVTTLVDV